MTEVCVRDIGSKPISPPKCIFPNKIVSTLMVKVASCLFLNLWPLVDHLAYRRFSRNSGE